MSWSLLICSLPKRSEIQNKLRLYAAGFRVLPPPKISLDSHGCTSISRLDWNTTLLPAPAASLDCSHHHSERDCDLEAALGWNLHWTPSFEPTNTSELASWPAEWHEPELLRPTFANQTKQITRTPWPKISSYSIT